MKTTQARFHPMLGHVIDGMKVSMDNGDEIVIKNSMKGWCLMKDGAVIGRTCKYAAEVENRILNYPFDFN
jgi:hypothetical protein